MGAHDQTAEVERLRGLVEVLRDEIKMLRAALGAIVNLAAHPMRAEVATDTNEGKGPRSDARRKA